MTSVVWYSLSTTNAVPDDDSFWRQDIDRMSKTIESFHLRILGGDRAAEVELGKYKEARIQIVADTRQVNVQIYNCREIEQLLTVRRRSRMLSA